MSTTHGTYDPPMSWRVSTFPDIEQSRGADGGSIVNVTGTPELAVAPIDWAPRGEYDVGNAVHGWCSEAFPTEKV